MNVTRAFLAGVGVAYFLDPQQGRRRRRVLRARLGRLLRRGARFGVTRARFTSGRLAGLVARTRHRIAPPTRSVDDQTVMQRIRSDALRDVGVPAGAVDVEVRDGVAVLRGSVENRLLADDLVDRVRGVAGVQSVEDALEIVAEPPSHAAEN